MAPNNFIRDWGGRIEVRCLALCTKQSKVKTVISETEFKGQYFPWLSDTWMGTGRFNEYLGSSKCLSLTIDVQKVHRCVTLVSSIREQNYNLQGRSRASN